MDVVENAYTHYNIDPNIVTNEKIKSKVYTNPKYPDIKYKIINYDDKYVCDNDTKLGVYRSVILSEGSDTDSEKLLCFTPPKGLTYDKFIESYGNTTVNTYINEIIEGTMLTLFYDERTQEWDIASKSAIGGNYWFFRNQYELDNQKKEKKSQLTFREMFLQAMRSQAMRSQAFKDINDIAFLEYLSKEYCYNFVLQHPDNHIVLNIESPVLYLVSVYHIVDSIASFIPPYVYEEWDCFLNVRGIIEFPMSYNQSTYEELRLNHCSIQSPPISVGVMITNLETGDRTCIENPSYKALREIRGNHPNLHYQYLCLRRLGKDKIMEFVGYFPQYKEIFFKFYKQFGDFITNIHQSYVSYYIKKSGQTISKQFFPIVYRIHHEVYLPSITNNENSVNTKIIIKREVVKDYIEKMNPIELIYYLNFNKVKNSMGSEDKE